VGIPPGTLLARSTHLARLCSDTLRAKHVGVMVKDRYAESGNPFRPESQWASLPEGVCGRTEGLAPACPCSASDKRAGHVDFRMLRFPTFYRAEGFFKFIAAA
jgi:hypothetical protein